MIVMRRIGPAAPGLRDMASAADEVARPWAMAPAAAALPSRNAADRAPQRTPVAAAPPAPASCASARSARPPGATMPIRTAFLSIRKSPSASGNVSVFFVRRGQVDVHGGERDENEGLGHGGEQAEDHQGPGHDDREQARE